jgi:hypothetical protein
VICGEGGRRENRRNTKKDCGEKSKMRRRKESIRIESGKKE